MKVYLKDAISKEAYERLASRVEIVSTFDHPEEIDGILRRTDKITREMIEKATNLKAIVMHGVGLDGIDLEAAKERNIPVFNVPSQNAESVAELALAQIMAASRCLKKANTGIAESRYQFYAKYDFMGHEVYHKTLGLVGSGQIARILARMMTSAFGVKVAAYDPFVSKEKMAEFGFEKVDTIEELFGKADFISVHVPLTDSTRNLIGKSCFDNAHKNLVLVSTARGGVIDEEELYKALQDGRVMGAALDVFTSEPPKGDNPLVHLENCIATPHIGGSTEECLLRVGHEAIDKLLIALGREP